MSNSILTRRSVLQTGAVAGAGLALPTILTAGSHSGYTNAPTGGTVTLGFNVPQTGAYADEGADELRAYELAVEHLNGGGDGGMMNTFSSNSTPHLNDFHLGRMQRFCRVLASLGRSMYHSQVLQHSKRT